MSVSKKERARAKRQERATAIFERKSIEAASRLGFRMMSRSLTAFKRNRPLELPKILAQEYERARVVLVEAMTLAYLTGLDRLREGKGQVLQAALLHRAATEALKTRLQIDPSKLAEVTEKMNVQAVRVLKRSSDAVETALQKSILTITEEGLTTREGTKVLRDTFARNGIVPVNSFEIEAVFRTQTQYAYSAGTWNAAQDPAVDEILWGYKYVTVGDDRVRDSHEALDGTTAPKDSGIWGSIWPPNGWGCFLPGTKIKGDPLWISKAAYSGGAVEMNTVDGRKLSVTANHPIATDHGWVSAGLLNQGDYLLADGSKIELVGIPASPVMSRGTVRNQKSPVVVEDIFDSFSAHGTRTLNISPLDLHGDAVFTTRKIDTVCANRKLMEQLDSALSVNLFGNLALTRNDLALPTESSLGHLDQFGPSLLSADGGFPSGSALSFDSTPVVLQARPLESLGIRTTPYRHAIATEKQDQSSSADPQIIRNLLRAGPGAVKLDRVANIRHFDFSGHVYDLQTRNGYIVSDSIVSSNCRCQVLFLFEPETPQFPTPKEIDGRIIQAVPDVGFDFNPGTILLPGKESVRRSVAISKGPLKKRPITR